MIPIHAMHLSNDDYPLLGFPPYMKKQMLFKHSLHGANRVYTYFGYGHIQTFPTNAMKQILRDNIE
jgi:hypothetical protein